jgi:hypothetical protein
MMDTHEPSLEDVFVSLDDGMTTLSLAPTTHAITSTTASAATTTVTPPTRELLLRVATLKDCIKGMKPKEWKKLLKTHGHSTHGSKRELHARVLELVVPVLVLAQTEAAAATQAAAEASVSHTPSDGLPRVMLPTSPSSFGALPPPVNSGGGEHAAGAAGTAVSAAHPAPPPPPLHNPHTVLLVTNEISKLASPGDAGTNYKHGACFQM